MTTYITNIWITEEPSSVMLQSNAMTEYDLQHHSFLDSNDYSTGLHTLLLF